MRCGPKNDPYLSTLRPCSEPPSIRHHMPQFSSLSSIIIDQSKVVAAGPVVPFPELAISTPTSSIPMTPLPTMLTNDSGNLAVPTKRVLTSSTFPCNANELQPEDHHVTLSRMREHSAVKHAFWQDHPIVSTLLLKRIWSSHGPWWILLKVAIALTSALALDLVTQNPDSTTATFIAWLSLSDVVSNGFKQSFSVFFGAVLGACIGVGLQAGLVPLSPYAIIGAVPLAVIITVYMLFLFQRENDFGALTNGAFSALFTVIVPNAYPPLALAPLPLQTLVVRLIAVSEGVVCGSIANILVSGLFYRRLFYQRHLAVARALRFAILDLARDPIGSQYAFGLVRDCQLSIQSALGEVSGIKTTRVKLSDNQTYADLHEYEATLTTYLKLLNLYAYVGFYKNQLDKKEQTVLVEILNNAYRILVEEVWGFDVPENLLSGPTFSWTQSAGEANKDTASEGSVAISSTSASSFPPDGLYTAPPTQSDFQPRDRVLPCKLEWLVKSLDSVLLELATDARISTGGWTAKQMSPL